MELSAEIKLRPTRIGFLVRPSDTTSIRRIMRLNACLWGGLYNPIIPVCSKGIPKIWKKDRYGPQSGKEITEGYIRFFEPDVYVEAKEGLLEKAGLLETKKNWCVYGLTILRFPQVLGALSILITEVTVPKKSLWQV